MFGADDIANAFYGSIGVEDRAWLMSQQDYQRAWDKLKGWYLNWFATGRWGRVANPEFTTDTQKKARAARVYANILLFGYYKGFCSHTYITGQASVFPGMFTGDTGTQIGNLLTQMAEAYQRRSSGVYSSVLFFRTDCHESQVISDDNHWIVSYPVLPGAESINPNFSPMGLAFVDRDEFQSIAQRRSGSPATVDEPPPIPARYATVRPRTTSTPGFVSADWAVNADGQNISRNQSPRRNATSHETCDQRKREIQDFVLFEAIEGYLVGRQTPFPVTGGQLNNLFRLFGLARVGVVDYAVAAQVAHGFIARSSAVAFSTVYDWFTDLAGRLPGAEDRNSAYHSYGISLELRAEMDWVRDNIPSRHNIPDDPFLSAYCSVRLGALLADEAAGALSANSGHSPSHYAEVFATFSGSIRNRVPIVNTRSTFIPKIESTINAIQAGSDIRTPVTRSGQRYNTACHEFPSRGNSPQMVGSIDNNTYNLTLGGKLIFRINPNGEMELGEDITPTAAGSHLWDLVAREWEGLRSIAVDSGLTATQKAQIGELQNKNRAVTQEANSYKNTVTGLKEEIKQLRAGFAKEVEDKLSLIYPKEIPAAERAIVEKAIAFTKQLKAAGDAKTSPSVDLVRNPSLIILGDEILRLRGLLVASNELAKTYQDAAASLWACLHSDGEKIVAMAPKGDPVAVGEWVTKILDNKSQDLARLVFTEPGA